MLQCLKISIFLSSLKGSLLSSRKRKKKKGAFLWLLCDRLCADWCLRSVSALAEVHMAFETHDAFFVYIIIIANYAKCIFPWYLMPLPFTEVFFSCSLFHATFRSHVRLSILFILFTITNVVTNLFSAAQHVLYGYILCQITDTYVFVCIYEKSNLPCSVQYYGSCTYKPVKGKCCFSLT